MFSFFLYVDSEFSRSRASCNRGEVVAVLLKFMLLLDDDDASSLSVVAVAVAVAEPCDDVDETPTVGVR